MNWRGYKALDQPAVLRAIIILSFLVLYEAPFFQRLKFGTQWLRFPIVDVGFVDNPTTFVILESVYACASVLACFRRFVIPACFLAGTASILLVALDLSDRLQFSYLPGGALLAFGLSEALKRSQRFERRADLPLAMLLGSIYGFASFHKGLNFHSMQNALPTAVIGASRGALDLFGTSKDAFFFQLTTWAVVPYEATLSILTLTTRWMKTRIVLVCVFHWILAVLAPHIWHVSLFMMCLQLYLLSLQAPIVARRIVVERNWLVLLGAEALFAALRIAAGSIAGSVGLLLAHVAFASLVLFPIWFLLWPFLRAESLRVEAPLPALRSIGAASLAAFGALLLAFGCSPLLLPQRYSVRSLGWSMFAGGEYTVGVYYSLKTPTSPCFRYPNVAGVLWFDVVDNHIVYGSYRRLDLERLQRFFERQRKCPGPRLQIEAARF